MANIGDVAHDVANYVADLALTKLPRAAAPAFTSAMVKLVDLSIDGKGRLPGVKHVAGRYLARQQEVEPAIRTAIRHHLALAAAQGVVTNIGGAFSMLIGTPANVTGVIVVQIRMVACIAHLSGYDIDDPRVRTAVVMCLLGDQELERQISDHRLPSTPLAVATSPVHDPQLHAAVADRVLTHILADAAGKGLVTTIGRKAPIIGGGVGGVADWLDTMTVSRCAQANLPTRRRITA